MQQAQENVLVGIAEPINGQGENLLIDHFLGYANQELEPQEIDKVVNGEVVEGITAYAQGHYYKISANPEIQNAKDFEISLHFQDGPIHVHGVNGVTRLVPANIVVKVHSMAFDRDLGATSFAAAIAAKPYAVYNFL
ncbi:hypothetical protein [Acinetobacter baumannii]|uniref:hypothetical protein n=1 Tax=Acinetobacter baumannii TaxID=470 RepID=UPI000AF535D6|nr:hypothetical protein [Acinetobacter baumannii]